MKAVSILSDEGLADARARLVGPQYGPAVRDGCEWNPKLDAPARDDDDHYRLVQADVIVGSDGQWRLCAECAALPKFNRFKVRKPIERR